LYIHRFGIAVCFSCRLAHNSETKLQVNLKTEFSRVTIENTVTTSENHLPLESMQPIPNKSNVDMCSLFPEKVDVSFFDATMKKHLNSALDRKTQILREISLRALGSLTLIRFSFDKKFKDIFDITLGFDDFDKRFSPYFDKFIDVQIYFLEMLSSNQWKSEGKFQTAIIHYLGVLLRLMDLCEFITDGKIHGPFWNGKFSQKQLSHNSKKMAMSHPQLSVLMDIFKQGIISELKPSMKWMFCR